MLSNVDGSLNSNLLPGALPAIDAENSLTPRRASKSCAAAGKLTRRWIPRLIADSQVDQQDWISRGATASLPAH
jgi:hypothetical protein